MRRRSTPAGLRLVLISTDLRSLTLCCVASSFHSTIFAASPRCHRLARPPTRIDRQPTFLTGRDNVRRVARFINSPRVDLLVKKEKKKKKKIKKKYRFSPIISYAYYPCLFLLDVNYSAMYLASLRRNRLFVEQEREKKEKTRRLERRQISSVR